MKEWRSGRCRTGPSGSPAHSPTFAFPLIRSCVLRPVIGGDMLFGLDAPGALPAQAGVLRGQGRQELETVDREELTG